MKPTTLFFFQDFIAEEQLKLEFAEMRDAGATLQELGEIQQQIADLHVHSNVAFNFLLLPVTDPEGPIHTAMLEAYHNNTAYPTYEEMQQLQPDLADKAPFSQIADELQDVYMDAHAWVRGDHKPNPYFAEMMKNGVSVEEFYLWAQSKGAFIHVEELPDYLQNAIAKVHEDMAETSLQYPGPLAIAIRNPLNGDPIDLIRPDDKVMDTYETYGIPARSGNPGEVFEDITFTRYGTIDTVSDQQWMENKRHLVELPNGEVYFTEQKEGVNIVNELLRQGHPVNLEHGTILYGDATELANNPEQAQQILHELQSHGAAFPGTEGQEQGWHLPTHHAGDLFENFSGTDFSAGEMLAGGLGVLSAAKPLIYMAVMVQRAGGMEKIVNGLKFQAGVNAGMMKENIADIWENRVSNPIEKQMDKLHERVDSIEEYGPKRRMLHHLSNPITNSVSQIGNKLMDGIQLRMGPDEPNMRINFQTNSEGNVVLETNSRKVAHDIWEALKGSSGMKDNAYDHQKWLDGETRWPRYSITINPQLTPMQEEQGAKGFKSIIYKKELQEAASSVAQKYEVENPSIPALRNGLLSR